MAHDPYYELVPEPKELPFDPRKTALLIIDLQYLDAHPDGWMGRLCRAQGRPDLLNERWAFEGYANFIAEKGLDETGNPTGAETNIDMQLMYDAGAHFGQTKNRFRVGVEYQFWNNKFGNTRATTGGRGQRASTPMIAMTEMTAMTLASGMPPVLAPPTCFSFSIPSRTLRVKPVLSVYS